MSATRPRTDPYHLYRLPLLVVALLVLVLACGSDDSATELGVQDLDSDGIVDSEDDDIDGDGISNAQEGSGEVDTDSDGITDDRDRDSDGDGVFDIDESGSDSGAETNNGDGDSDGTPDDDQDGDGVADTQDNCVDEPNSDQEDADGDGVGDACDDCPQDETETDQPCNDPVPPTDEDQCVGFDGGAAGPVFIPGVQSANGVATQGTASVIALNELSGVFAACVPTGGGYGGPIFNCDLISVSASNGITIDPVTASRGGIYFTFASDGFLANDSLASGFPENFSFAMAVDGCDDPDPAPRSSVTLLELTEDAKVRHPSRLDLAVLPTEELDLSPALKESIGAAGQ